jgi:hypothetical protein
MSGNTGMISVFLCLTDKKNMKKTFLLPLFVIISITISAQQPRTFLIDPNRLVSLKNKVAQRDKTTLQLIDSLKKQANDLLNKKPVSVMDKAFTPPSGSKHDYMSQAPYFWYDSSKANGLPYLRRDGERNPEINKITDHRYLDDLSSTTRTLALAWYFTGEEKYAEKATALLSHWFFNNDTKMNPNLEYAQAVPGVNTGRGIGLIETRSLTGIADASGLLSGSGSWTKKNDETLRQWYTQFLDWMLTSKNGKDENAAKNNHGTWYSVQAIDFALFTGNGEKAKQLAEGAKRRLDSQVTKEGKQPLELARTNALGYSTMNLRGWFELARLAEITGVDLWNYKNANGATLKTVLDWLIPFATGEKKWDYQQIGRYNKNEIYSILLLAGPKFNDSGYLDLANKIQKEGTPWMTDLLYKQ